MNVYIQINIWNCRNFSSIYLAIFDLFFNVSTIFFGSKKGRVEIVDLFQRIDCNELLDNFKCDCLLLALLEQIYNIDNS